MRAKLNVAAIVTGLSVFIITLIFWPVNALLRRHYHMAPALSPGYRRARRYGRLAMILNLAFISFWLHTLASAGSDIGALSSDRAGVMHAMQVLGLVGVLGFVAAAWMLMRAWQDRALWLWAKWWNTALVIGFAGYVFFVLNGRLLAFGLHY